MMGFSQEYLERMEKEEIIVEPDHDHICKHCPTTGNTCDSCHGSGISEFVSVLNTIEDCQSCGPCKGEGVIAND